LHSRKEPIEPGDVAQSVEQRTENPCVGGSIPSITTECKANRLIIFELSSGFLFGLHSGLQSRRNRQSTADNSFNLAGKKSSFAARPGSEISTSRPASIPKTAHSFYPFLNSRSKFSLSLLYREIRQNAPKRPLDAFNTS
jgi:hypothetical protein